MPERRVWLLLLLALLLRLATLWWDSGLLSPHPDERQVAFVSERIEGWFDDPSFYAYGSLHFHGVRLVAGALGLAGRYSGLLMGGRVLSLAAVMVAIGIGWWLARRVWGRPTAWLYLVLVAFVPLDLQQAHFATVEAHHTAWVVVALAACWCLAVWRSRPWAVAAGAAIGASLAVKVASLGLLVPLAVALAIAVRDRAWLRGLELAAIAGTAVVLAFWLTQPWAFADGRPPLPVLALAALAVLLVREAGRAGGRRAVIWLAAGIGAGATAALAGAGVLGADLAVTLHPGYLRGVGEQVAMVAGKADLPYVRVYHGTLPVAYPLVELVRWGVGPLALGVLAGMVAGVWWLGRRWRRWLAGRWTPATALLAVLLAWLVPMAARLSTLEVKYLRYWQPLVVPGVMVAAWWLLRTRRRLRRVLVPAAVAATVAWGVTFLAAFTEPHPHRTAARWLRPMIADEQLVAFEHWDETLAIPGVRRVELPSYELPDDDRKLRAWCETLAASDWVVLTSNRVRRTVLANPHRYPRTGRLYRLLLAGEAGFEPLTRVDRSPGLLGLDRPVQLADESFLNYDFPRVVVLRRVREVDAAALAERTRRPLPFLEQLSSVALERRFVDRLPAVRPPPTAASQAIDAASWLAVLAVLAVGAWSLLLPVVRGWPDAGLGLALATGWLAPAWLLWLGSELGLWPVGPATASVILSGLLAGGLVAGWRRRRLAARLWRQRRRSMLAVLTVAAAVGLLFAAVRASNPAVFWGEKPMDFSFLNAFLRADAWPTDEPWLAGMPLHYYYFGEVLASFPILLAGVDPAVGYNLMAATLPALSAALLAALGLALMRRGRLAAAALLPLLVLLTGNLAWPFLVELARTGQWFDLWWATSRVIPGFAIDEYPLWTALFADLHGHFIALPVLLAALAWGWMTVRLGRGWPLAAALAGVSAAVLLATNPWDLLVLTGALGVACLAAAPRPLIGMVRLAVAAIASLVAGLPFVVELVAGIGAGAGGRLLLLTDADFAPAWAILRHFGQFLAPLAALAAVSAGGHWLWVAPVAAGCVVLGLGFGSSAAALALASAALLAAPALRSRDRRARLTWALAALGMAAVAACERVTLIDRMNTLFKVYNGVWVLLAVALGVRLLRERGWRRRLLLVVWAPLQIVALVNLPLGIAQGWLRPRIASPRPTLDGRAYLASQDPQTWFLVQALQAVAQPDDVVAEGFREAYGPSTRIAMHTGQPTVVGWPWHLQQRGQPRAEIEARYADLELLYAGSDPAARRAVLDRYRVTWVVLADLERATYRLAGDDPLDGVPGLVRLLERDGAALYLVASQAMGAPATAAARRDLPAGVTAIGSVPVVGAELVRSLALDGDRGTAVLRDGTLYRLERLGRPGGAVPGPPCTVASVEHRPGELWVGCADGGVWRRTGETWRPVAAIEGRANLTADRSVWAWGEGGLWRLEDADRWTRVVRSPVSAAAALESAVAVSDGAGVWLYRDGGSQRIGAALPGVRWLAWQGTVLWALADGELYRSGGGVLPWRRALAGLPEVSALAGGDDRLWVVLDDGVLVEQLAPRCQSPWEAGDLAEPRDLAAAAEGWLVVADTLHHRLRFFSHGGACLDQYGEEGDLAGQFRQPAGLSLARDGTLAVADTWNSRVQLLRPDGGVEIVGQSIYGPRDLLWRPDGGLLVSDTGNRLLVGYRPPRWEREELYRFPAPVVGLEWTGGMVAAALPVAAQVVLLDPQTWTAFRTLPVPGWEGGSQQEGYLLALPSGNLLASAPEASQLWLLDPTGGRPPRRVRDDLPGVTGLALLPDGQVVATLTWENRLIRLQVEE